MTAKQKPTKFVTNNEYRIAMNGVANSQRQLEIKLERMVNSLHQQQEARWRDESQNTRGWLLEEVKDNWKKTLFLAAGLALFALLVAVLL